MGCCAVLCRYDHLPTAHPIGSLCSFPSFRLLSLFFTTKSGSARESFYADQAQNVVSCRAAVLAKGWFFFKKIFYRRVASTAQCAQGRYVADRTKTFAGRIPSTLYCLAKQETLCKARHDRLGTDQRKKRLTLGRKICVGYLVRRPSEPSCRPSYYFFDALLPVRPTTGKA